MNLLIADDEELIRRGMLSLDWKSIGIDEVYSAANGYEAENLLNTEKLDIVIFDIRMPGFTGLDLSRMIKEKSMDTAVILLTGFSEFQYAQEAIRYGVYEYMLKPLRPKDILETVNRVKIRLEQERYKNKVVRQYESQSGSFDLLSQVMNAFPKTTSVTSDILKRIATEFSQPLGLREIAAECHFSENYLSKKIKKETGESFAGILSAVRMTEAARLLAEGEKIGSVAEKVGITDQRYFSQVFRKYYECSPSDYRHKLTDEDDVPNFKDVLGLSEAHSDKRNRKRDDVNGTS
ncbi:MAG: response regulator [Lachnospiraceae bacterium]|jgi:two-component system response regulator YesN